MPSQKSTKQAGFFDYLTIIDNFLEKILLKKAPSLPKKITNYLVKIVPYIAIAMVALYLPWFVLRGIGLTFGLIFSFQFIAAFVNAAYLFGLLLTGLSIPGLYKRYKGAWVLNFYAALLFAFGVIDIVNSLDFFVFFGSYTVYLYLLYQLKPFYKK